MYTAKDVAELRSKTGVGMMDCKKALDENKGNMEASIKWLREKGLSQAAKKSDRIAAEGVVASYIHMGGKIGVMVEVNCETDFAAKGEKFNLLVKDIAMQIAASKPSYVSSSEVPASVLESERQILLAQAKNEGKKPEVAEKMVEGRIKKYYQENCLLEQAFVKDTDKKVLDIINDAVLVIGEKISVRRFVRWEMGEGLEKKVHDLAADVAEQSK